MHKQKSRDAIKDITDKKCNQNNTMTNIAKSEKKSKNGNNPTITSIPLEIFDELADDLDDFDILQLNRVRKFSPIV